MSALTLEKPDLEAVLAKATLNAAEQLGLKQSELAAVLGLHRTAISRLKQNPTLDPASKQGELALLLIRIARALHALTGGDKEWMQHFMSTHNKVTGGVPTEQIASIQGLMTVLQFVDAVRSKV
ncbi:MAG: helix-turn-helix transcriptional regulator [Marinagarivorans sp.]|nr:helix-turn-helix transcriptional regulator [Marinagarivorans sp.]